MSSHPRPLSVTPSRYTLSPYNRTGNLHTSYLSLPSPYDIRDIETRADLVNSALHVWSLGRLSYLDPEPEAEEKTEEEKCPICFDRFVPVTTAHPSTIENPIRTPCGHTFGNFCLRSWLEINDTCPLCRTHLIFDDSLPRAPAAPSPPPLTYLPYPESLSQLSVPYTFPSTNSQSSTSIYHTPRGILQDNSSLPIIADAQFQSAANFAAAAAADPRFFSPLPYDSFSRPARHQREYQNEIEIDRARTRWRSRTRGGERERARARRSHSTSIMQLPVSEHPSFPRLRNTVPQYEAAANEDSEWVNGIYAIEEEVSHGGRRTRLLRTESMDERMLWDGTVVWEFDDVPLPPAQPATLPAEYANELHIQGLQIHDPESALNLNTIRGGYFDGEEEDEATHAHPDFHAQRNPNSHSETNRSNTIRRSVTDTYTRTEYPDVGIVAYSLTNRDRERRSAFRELGGNDEDEVTHAHPNFHPQRNPNPHSERNRANAIRTSVTDTYTRTEYPDVGIVAYSLTNRDLERRSALREVAGGRRGVEFRRESLRRGGEGYGYGYGYGYGLVSDARARARARSRSVSSGEYRGGQNGMGVRRGYGGGRDGYRNRGRRGAREWRSSGEMRREVEDELACLGGLGDSIWAD